MALRRWYIIVRRIGRPPQVLHTFGNLSDAIDDADGFNLMPGVHSVSVLLEESRMGSNPAGEQLEVF